MYRVGSSENPNTDELDGNMGIDHATNHNLYR